MNAKRAELWISAASVAVTVIVSAWGFTTDLRVSIAVLETRTASIEQTQRELRDEFRELRGRDAHRVAKPFTTAEHPPPPP